MGVRAAFFARQIDHGELLDLPEGQAWRGTAERVGGAITLLATALRSELPGMPILSVPHAVQGSPWTTNDFTLRVPWPRELRVGPGRTDPILIRAAEVLGAPFRAMRLGILPSQPFTDLRDAIISEPFWATAEDQVDSLSSADRRILGELSRELRPRLTEDAITEIAGHDSMDRLRLREQLVVEASKDERFYARIKAWHDMFNLLENALRVFQQIAVFGGVLQLPGEVHEVEIQTIGSETRARIVLNSENPFAIRSGWTVLVNAEALSDAIVVESLNSNLSLTGEPSRLVIEGPILTDSGTELRSSAVTRRMTSFREVTDVTGESSL